MSHEQTKSCPFNPYAPGFDTNPYPTFKELRTTAPITYWDQGHGWLITRYEDVVAVLRDNNRFSPNVADWEFASTMGTAAVLPEMYELGKSSIMMLSDADHARVRRLVSPAFTPRAVEWLRPEIQAIVDELLDAAEAKGTVNLVSDIADLIPSRVMGSLLKIPKGREVPFQRFTETVIKSLMPGMIPPAEVEALRKDIREGIALMRETIEERRRNPVQNDILTTLIQTEEQGDKLSTPELLSLVAALIVGGFETTVHLIGFTLSNILRRPELFAQLKTELELVKNVIEEVLRFDNFFKLGLTRYAREDVELSGVKIKKGQRLLIMVNSAMHDEAVFPQPETFDVRRNTTATVAFGNGMHFCLGANLARLEVRIAVGTLLKPHVMETSGSPRFLGNPPWTCSALRPRRDREVRPLRPPDAAFRCFDGVGSRDRFLSGLNHAARPLAVYASQSGLPRHHARLASGWWPPLPGRTRTCWVTREVSVLYRFLLTQALPGAPKLELRPFALSIRGPDRLFGQLIAPRYVFPGQL
jgi:cytochrome P450 enzyme